MRTRRGWLKLGAGVAALAVPGCAERQRGTTEPTPRARRLLVLGGTGFIGPHLVRHAVARGHHVTIFTRGKREAELPDGVVRLIGDRDGQLGALADGRWDAVIDDSASNPAYVQLSTQLLKQRVGRYLFTSSTGVYYPYLQRGADEARPVRTAVTDPEDGSEAYGVAKAQCEALVMQAFGARGSVVRPTYILGPGDTTDRFPYWPVRMQRGGEVLAPGRREDPVQWIDVRDLAEFMVRIVEAEMSGIFNVAQPSTAFPRFLETVRSVVNPRATLTWIDDYAFLEAHGILDATPWVMLKGNDEGHTSVRGERAVAAGLKFRPLATTVRDTAAWWPTVPEGRRLAPKFAISPDVEATALADWHARIP